MSTKTSISMLNALFDAKPGEEELNIIVRFPLHFMTDEELDGIGQLLMLGEFYIGYIDFEQDTSSYDHMITTTDCIQTAMEIILGEVPFFDVRLN